MFPVAEEILDGRVLQVLDSDYATISQRLENCGIALLPETEESAPEDPPTGA